MELLIREARPDDAEAVVSIFNPIIEAGLYTAFDTLFTVEAERVHLELSAARRFPCGGTSPGSKNCWFSKYGTICDLHARL